MKPIQKILVPFDGSEHSNEALARAADLARRYGASLLILYVDHPLTYALPKGYSQVTQEQLAQMRAKFESEVALEHRELRDAPLKVETLVQRGDPRTEILRMATDGEFDLIVMGTRGRSGITRALLGSVTENVVHRAPCSVLVVHLNEPQSSEARP